MRRIALTCALILVVLPSCRKPQAEAVMAAHLLARCLESMPDEKGCKAFPGHSLPEGFSRNLLSRKNYSAEYISRHSHRARSWEIIKVRTSDSTQVGYAIGNWTITLQVEGHDTTLYGKCLSIWKQEADGTWKNVREVNAMYPV